MDLNRIMRIIFKWSNPKPTKCESAVWQQFAKKEKRANRSTAGTIGPVFYRKRIKIKKFKSIELRKGVKGIELKSIENNEVSELRKEGKGIEIKSIENGEVVRKEVKGIEIKTSIENDEVNERNEGIE